MNEAHRAARKIAKRRPLDRVGNRAGVGQRRHQPPDQFPAQLAHAPRERRRALKKVRERRPLDRGNPRADRLPERGHEHCRPVDRERGERAEHRYRRASDVGDRRAGPPLAETLGLASDAVPDAGPPCSDAVPVLTDQNGPCGNGGDAERDRRECDGGDGPERRASKGQTSRRRADRKRSDGEVVEVGHERAERVAHVAEHDVQRVHALCRAAERVCRAVQLLHEDVVGVRHIAERALQYLERLRHVVRHRDEERRKRLVDAFGEPEPPRHQPAHDPARLGRGRAHLAERLVGVPRAVAHLRQSAFELFGGLPGQGHHRAERVHSPEQLRHDDFRPSRLLANVSDESGETFRLDGGGVEFEPEIVSRFFRFLRWIDDGGDDPAQPRHCLGRALSA